jgi:hypothetical protein
MKATTPDEKPKQSEATALTLKGGDELLKMLKESGYNYDRVGQGFVMPWKPPKNEKSDLESTQKNEA